MKMHDVEFEALLAQGARSRASDVHITAGFPPLQRVDGDLVPIDGYTTALSEEWVERAAFSLMADEQRLEFLDRGEVDLAHAADDIGRFRVNVFRQLGSIAIALRFIPDRVYSLEELGAPGDRTRPRPAASRARPAHRSYGLRQVHHSHRDGRHRQRARAGSHHHDRGPDRVPSREQAGARPPARSRHRYSIVRRSPAPRPPPGPRRDPDRRAPRPGVDPDRAVCG